MGALGRLLNWAETRGNWWPFLAGFFLAYVFAAAATGFWPLWLVSAAGLGMTALRPVGVRLWHRRLIAQTRQLLDEARAEAAARARKARDDGR